MAATSPASPREVPGAWPQQLLKGRFGHLSGPGIQGLYSHPRGAHWATLVRSPWGAPSRQVWDSPLAHDLAGVAGLLQQLRQQELRVRDAAHYLLRRVGWWSNAPCEPAGSSGRALVGAALQGHFSGLPAAPHSQHHYRSEQANVPPRGVRTSGVRGQGPGVRGQGRARPRGLQNSGSETTPSSKGCLKPHLVGEPTLEPGRPRPWDRKGAGPTLTVLPTRRKHVVSDGSSAFCFKVSYNPDRTLNPG